MKKQTKVLVAAAMLTLGASFSAMAAEKGTWKYEAGEWYCYDADGDVYEETWCLSDDGSKEYWVNEDGVMVTSDWADNGTYYVNSEGLKAKGEWRKLIPYEADEDAEAESFYFGTNGKKYADAKKVIDGKTYYFNEEGVMLTGWVDTSDNTLADKDSLKEGASIVYTLEEGEFRGARVATDWVETAVPGTAEEDKADADKFWYYIGSKGTATFGKKSNIKGATYFFGEDGKMLSGWVLGKASGSNTIYTEIGTKANKGAELSSFEGDVYFCGASNDGHAQKNKWIEEYNVGSYNGADGDTDKYWFWVEKDGKVFLKDADTAAAANSVTFVDGEEANPFKAEAIEDGVSTKKINGETYAFNVNGEMQSGLIEMGGYYYYFGESTDGARKEGSQTLTDDYGIDYKFLFADGKEDDYEDFAGVTGAKGGKLYKNGLLITATETKYYKALDVDGKGANYIVNKSGSIQTTNKEYKDGDDMIFDASDAKKVTFNDGKADAKLKGAYTVAK